MRLEFVSFPVESVAFGKQTRYSGGVLEIEKQEILSLLLADKRIASAELYIAVPGEKTRIVNVRDAVEPRIKVSGQGCVFPGIMGPVLTVGDGRTNSLRGFAIVTSVDYRATIPTGSASGSTGVIDMWGPVSTLTPLGATNNLVLTLKLTDPISELDALTAIQMAEFKVGNRLAETTIDSETGQTEVFDLRPVSAALPRVLYILSCISFRVGQHQPHSRLALYGLSIEESMPTLLHPNELLDGALTKDPRLGRSNSPSNWGFMNHPMVFKLLREHGKSLNFLGVILQRTRYISEFGKFVTSQVTSQMARMLGADGVIITKTSPSGNNDVDMMLTIQACENKGVKTVFLAPERSGRDGTEQAFVFQLPEADAVVNTCTIDRMVKLPKPGRVLGLFDDQFITIAGGEQPLAPWEEITLDNREGIPEGVDWWGRMNYTCKQY